MTSLGQEIPTFWNNILAGKPAVTAICLLLKMRTAFTADLKLLSCVMLVSPPAALPQHDGDRTSQANITAVDFVGVGIRSIRKSVDARTQRGRRDTAESLV